MGKDIKREEHCELRKEGKKLRVENIEKKEIRGI